MHADPELTLAATYHPGNQVVGIMRGHLATALKFLGEGKASGSRIHAARQELKRARAMLRLLRESVDAEHFRQEDSTLRQATRLLNRARDSDVLLRVFSRVRGSVKNAPSRTNLDALREVLVQERRSAISKALREPLNSVRTLLLESRGRTHEWHVANDPDLLTEAMRRTYRKGRACYRAARESHSDEHLHAWRRQAKYSAYQLEAIGSPTPARMTRRLRRSARLAKTLGKDHDLALLHRRIFDADLDAATALHLMNAIRHERVKLQREALELGARLYRAKSRQFHL